MIKMTDKLVPVPCDGGMYPCYEPGCGHYQNASDVVSSIYYGDDGLYCINHINRPLELPDEPESDELAETNPTDNG